jgi:hypothetical protein
MNASFSRKDDYPPERYMQESVKSGPFKGHKCDREEWDKMLDRYYELNGWDKMTGLQTCSCLAELGMEDIIDMLPIGKDEPQFISHKPKNFLRETFKERETRDDH